MLTVQNDWIRYESGAIAARAAAAAAPARRVAVRGGAACAQRGPVERTRYSPTTVARHTARPVTATRPGRLRLTRRGRFVLLVMPALLALSGALIALSGPAIAEASPRAAVTPQAVVVGSGDSLWTIAERIAPHTDPRVVVAALRHANGLHGSAPAAGSVLLLPAH